MSNSNDDIIHDEFFKLFRPLYILTCILGSTRISYKNKIVCNTSSIQKVYSCALMTVGVYGFYYLTFKLESSVSQNASQSLPNYFQFCNIIFMYTTLMMSNTFGYPKLNRKIYVILQNVDRSLKIVGKEEHYRYIYRRNCFCGLIFTVYIGGMYTAFTSSMLLTTNVSQYFIVLFAFCAFSIEDLELFHYSVFILFLTKRVEYINDVMEHRAKVSWRESMTNCDGQDAERLAWYRIFEAYRSIAKAFTTLQRIHQLHVFTATAFTFTSLLVAVQRCIMFDIEIRISHILLITLILMKTCYSPVYMGVANQSFFSQLKRTKNNCLLLLNKHRNGPIRKIAKNIMRTLTVDMKPFTVYGVFTVDAKLPLRLLALTTTYTVVLLQFAFL